MTIQINGTTVINDSRAITNVTSYSGPGIASQSEAQAGTNNNQLMTPLRVAQAIAAQAGTVINRIQRGTLSISNGTSSATATITSVNMSKSFVNTGGHWWGGQYNEYAAGSMKINSSTQVRIQGPYNYGVSNYAYYEVIEFK